MTRLIIDQTVLKYYNRLGSEEFVEGSIPDNKSQFCQISIFIFDPNQNSNFPT